MENDIRNDGLEAEGLVLKPVYMKIHHNKQQ